jgi:diguanylate cyclase (GGDEF)-like protein
MARWSQGLTRLTLGWRSPAPGAPNPPRSVVDLHAWSEEPEAIRARVVPPLADARLRLERATQVAELGRLLRLLAATALFFGTAEVAASLAFRSPPVAVTGAALGAYGIWLAIGWRRMHTQPVARFVTRVAVGLMLVIGLTAIMQPAGAVVLVVTALLAVVIALPYLPESGLRWVMVVSWAIAVLVVAVAELSPSSSNLPPLTTAALRLSGVAAGVALVLVAMRQSARRLRESAVELQALVAMSSELSQTLDSREIGDLMPRHLGEAAGADEAAICYLDAPRDRILTYGYFPLERRSAVADEYELRDYPLTRRVLDEQVEAIVHVGDRNADPSEVEYLRSIDQQAMAMLPLVVKGRTIGTLELTSASPVRFDERRLAIARVLAAEAAIVLENAMLYSELRVQAFHDAMTGLPNRALFQDRLQHALARASREGVPNLAVMFLDLDDFKTVNDHHGHVFGDQVIAAIARRIEGCLRPGDTAGRLGGDEFAILVEDTSTHDAERLGDRIISSIAAPLELGDTETTISASVGVAHGGSGGRTADELLRNADFAMYRAKALGKGRLVPFEPGQRESAVERARTEADLRVAVENNRLRLDYQPIVELSTGLAVGVEALLRWEPRDGVVRMPADFIGLAEETGLIVPFGRWVLAEACRQACEWQREIGRPDFGVSVNLSARQFQHPALVDDVRSALEATGLEPGSLSLEITESVLMQKTAPTIAKLGELRGLGVHLAIDDFGTGYSSLSYLQLFPVDTLKIDKSFLDGLTGAGDGQVLGRAIIQLGHALKLDIVAEGIETEEQLRGLSELQCQFGQGYLFANPQPARNVLALLRAPLGPPPATVLRLDGRLARKGRRADGTPRSRARKGADVGVEAAVERPA